MIDFCNYKKTIIMSDIINYTFLLLINHEIIVNKIKLHKEEEHLTRCIITNYLLCNYHL